MSCGLTEPTHRRGDRAFRACWCVAIRRLFRDKQLRTLDFASKNSVRARSFRAIVGAVAVFSNPGMSLERSERAHSGFASDVNACPDVPVDRASSCANQIPTTPANQRNPVQGDEARRPVGELWRWRALLGRRARRRSAWLGIPLDGNAAFPALIARSNRKGSQ